MTQPERAGGSCNIWSMSKELSFRCEVRRKTRRVDILDLSRRRPARKFDRNVRLRTRGVARGLSEDGATSANPQPDFYDLSTGLQPIKRPARRLTEFRSISPSEDLPTAITYLEDEEFDGLSVQRSTKQGGEVDFPTGLRRGWRRRVRFRRKRGRGQVVKQLRCH